jgi:ADP-ribose pyrophosphatase YjhB (NUDIX family)
MTVGSDRFRRRLLGGYGRLPAGVRGRLTHLAAPSFTAGALAVVERSDGRLLLVRHSYRPNWGLPGGFLKRREAPDDGARREVREEVGLVVELVSGPAVVVAPRWRRVDLIYRARPAEGVDPDAVRPVSAEIVDVAWCSPTDLPRLQEEATEALVALARWAQPDASRPRP